MEKIHASQLPARLKKLGAKFMPDRSSTKAHIFWAPASQRWIKVVRSGASEVTLTAHATCPCSGG